MAVTSALAVGTRERGEAAAWQSLSVHCVGIDIIAAAIISMVSVTMKYTFGLYSANATYTKVPAGYSLRAQRS